MHPAAAAARDKNTKAKRDRQLIEEHFDQVDESDDDEDADNKPSKSMHTPDVCNHVHLY